MLAKKSPICPSMPRISFGPALVKPFKRLAPPPRLDVKEIDGTVGPEDVPNGDGMVIVRVADARLLLPICTPPPMEATTVMVSALNVGVTSTFEGVSSETSSLLLVLTSCG